MKARAQRNAQLTPNRLAGQAARILTVQQVADLLQIPKSSVYEKCRASHGNTPALPFRHVGRYLRFFEAEVLAWMNALPKNYVIRRKRRKA